jgi:transcription-repair coupling factor (superfamily II helicase)
VRLNLHARLARLASLDEVEAFAEELEDRFGPPPDAIDGLFARAQAAIFCRELGIEKIEAGPKGIAIAFRGGHVMGAKAGPGGASSRRKPLIVAKATESGRERHAVVLEVLRKLKAGEIAGAQQMKR